MFHCGFSSFSYISLFHPFNELNDGSGQAISQSMWVFAHQVCTKKVAISHSLRLPVPGEVNKFTVLQQVPARCS